VPDELADRRSQLFVEVVRERERAAPLGDLGGVERRLGEALLQRGDYRGRVADVAAVQAQHGKGVMGATGEPEGDGHVGAGDRRATAVLDALPGKRPARLLAVVRDVDLPENRLVVRHEV